MLQEKILETRKAKAEKPAIVVRNVTKEFIIPHERRTTIFENLRGVFSPSTYEKFVAIKDVSFTVNRGESVGIIGDNGSGKSTLLKIISRILRPTSGSIEINGKITPFLELGVGFQPDMTAKENIEVYSTIMGMSDKEIAGNIDHVLEFAGLTNFRDTKLKNFSSGMQVRLAFATAIQKKPDILLVDEVLAVRDMDFQQKSLDIFRRYRDEGVTILFVSHDLNSVRNFCEKTLLLRNGEFVAYGDTNEVIDMYIYGIKLDAHAQIEQAQGKDNKCVELSESPNTGSTNPVKKYSVDECRRGNKKIEIANVKFIDKYGGEGSRVSSNDSLVIHINYIVNEPVENPLFGIEIIDERGIPCFGTHNGLKKFPINQLNTNGTLLIRFPHIPLLQGKYRMTVAITSNDYGIIYDWLDKKYSFNVINNTGDNGYIRFECEFELAE